MTKVLSILNSLVVASLLGLNFSLFTPKVVLAQYQPVVPQPSVIIAISKEVKNPATGNFVKNLSSRDFAFLPLQTVEFRITVRNNGQTGLTNIQIKDQLPEFVEFVSGPGNFDAGSRSVNFTVDSLNPGESKSFSVIAKVLPQDKGGNVPNACLTNFAQATVGGMNVSDTAVFCIGSKVLGNVSELPVTGPESTLFVLWEATAFLILALLLSNKIFSKR